MNFRSAAPLFCFLLHWPLVSHAYDREIWTHFTDMNDVTSLAEGDDKIYVGTTGGILRYDRFSDRWLRPLTTLDGLPDNRIEDLSFDRNSGELWVDTFRGTVRWLSRIETLLHGGERPAKLRRPRQRPAIPQVFPPFGYDLGRDRVRGPNRWSYPITDVLIDSWKILWIGTFGLGVGRADLGHGQLEFHPFGPLQENVTAIALDEGNIWFGGGPSYRGSKEGITRYDLQTEAWEHFRPREIIGLNDGDVSTILADGSRVWFGTATGLARYTKRGRNWVTYRLGRRGRDRVTALFRTEGRLWIGTEAGLAVLDLKADTVRIVEGSERFDIRAIAGGSEQIWTATDLGLYQCHHTELIWRPAEGLDQLTRSPMVGLFVREHEVWAASKAPPGLAHLPAPEADWHWFPLAELGGSERTAVAADSTRVWIGTEGGAFRLDIASGLWRAYGSLDGLIHDRVQAVLLQEEYVWFGTPRGIGRYHWAGDFFEQGR